MSRAKSFFFRVSLRIKWNLSESIAIIAHQSRKVNIEYQQTMSKGLTWWLGELADFAVYL
jgi:hypothetical protein